MTEQEKNPVAVLRHQIMSESVGNQLRAALPEHITVEKFRRVLLTAVNSNQKLVEAGRHSLMTACIECASRGLLPNGEEAALVMFKDQVQFMAMIAGIYKLARNSGDVVSINARVVHEGDEFTYEYGLDQNLVHRPAASNTSDDSKIQYVYAVVVLRDGTRDFEVMNRAEIERIRKVSRNPDKGPWSKWWGEMAKKTVVHRLAKRIPMSDERLSGAIQQVNSLYDMDGNGQERPMKVVSTPPKREDFDEDHLVAEYEAMQTLDTESDQFEFVNEDGEMCNGVESYEDTIKRLNDLGALEGVWESNLDQINDLRKTDAETAEALTKLFMERRGALKEAA